METLFYNCPSIVDLPQKKYKRRLNNFNQQEVNIPVKGDNFGSPNMEVGVHYQAIDGFGQDSHRVDALLLNSVFCYEDIVPFSDFVINADYTINIDGNVLYRNEGDVVVKNKKQSSRFI